MNNDPSLCSEWTPAPGDLDEAWAWRTLNGLGRKGAIQMLIDSPSTLPEVLYYSKGSCLLYYFGVLLDYLLSEEAKANFAAAAGFMNLLNTRHLSPTLCVGTAGITLLEGARQIAARQDFYDADEDIFGSFPELYKRYASG
jgi:hypothetical protein